MDRMGYKRRSTILKKLSFTWNYHDYKVLVSVIIRSKKFNNKPINEIAIAPTKKVKKFELSPNFL